jgi:hypothetical protein
MASKRKNSLVANINRRKRAGKSRPKSRSTVSKESYDQMEKGWPKSRKTATKKPTSSDVYAPVGGSSAPTSLLAWTNPVSNDAVKIGFKQPVKANDALRTGSYAKTLTFTLSTTNP